MSKNNNSVYFGSLISNFQTCFTASYPSITGSQPCWLHSPPSYRPSSDYLR